MILLLGAAQVSAAPHRDLDDTPKSTAANNAAVRTVQGKATECVIKKMRTMLANTAEPESVQKFSDRLVEAVRACAPEMRTMIAAYDRTFGAGQGEEFFMGPYLDLLPTMIEEKLRDTAGP